MMYSIQHNDSGGIATIIQHFYLFNYTSHAKDASIRLASLIAQCMHHDNLNCSSSITGKKIIQQSLHDNNATFAKKLKKLYISR